MKKIIGYDPKNYDHFKQTVNLALWKLQQDGLKVYAKRWTRKSPFQKARYKDEYVFPECWVYTLGSMGVVCNGEEVDGDYLKVAENLKMQLS